MWEQRASARASYTPAYSWEPTLGWADACACATIQPVRLRCLRRSVLGPAASSTETNSRRSALYRSAVCCAFIAASLAGQKPAPRPRYFKPQPQLTRGRARQPRARARQRRKKRRTKHRNKRATSAQLKKRWRSTTRRKSRRRPSGPAQSSAPS